MNTTVTATNLVDLVLAITVVEIAALAIYRHLTGRGIALRDFLANAISGLFLMLALRCLASNAGTTWVAAGLLAAGAAHVTDLLMRLRRRGSVPSTRRDAGSEEALA